MQQRHCVLCGVDCAERLFRPPAAPGPVVRCRQCGLVYISPIEDARALIFEGPVLSASASGAATSADLALLVGSWEAPILAAKAAEWPALQRNAAAALARLEQHLPAAHPRAAQRKLLDFGCGGGFVLRVAQERGWAPSGLEPLAGHAIYARAQGAGPVITDTLHPTTFPPASFDAITAFQVVEHLPDPAGVVAQLARLLKPGGLLLIEVPNIDTWSVRLLRRYHRHFAPDHLNFFSAHTLRLLLEQQGLRVVEHFSPARRMTIRHLIEDWGSHYVPPQVIRAAARTLNRLGLWHLVIKLNLGDIVTVVARRSDDGR
jgi:SAM-dependent methyltransferase